MTTSAQYASIATIQSGITTTADISYTAPTTATVGVIATATGGTAYRIDQLTNINTGTSVAGLHRLWICEGNVGPTISSITSATTTATLTTASVHNLITGDLITIRDSFPVEYNVTNVSVTVTSTTAFTFTIVSTGSIAARDVGTYTSTHVAPVYHLLRETPITAITGSTTAAANAYSLNSAINADLMPIVLPPGYSLRTTVSVTQTNGIKTTAFGGRF